MLFACISDRLVRVRKSLCRHGFPHSQKGQELETVEHRSLTAAQNLPQFLVHHEVGHKSPCSWPFQFALNELAFQGTTNTPSSCTRVTSLSALHRLHTRFRRGLGQNMISKRCCSAYSLAWCLCASPACGCALDFATATRLAALYTRLAYACA